MSRTEIVEKLKEILIMVNGEENLPELHDNMSLVDDLGLNSVGILYIIVGIEEFFSIRFDDVGFNDFPNLGAVIDYIEKKVNQ